MSFDVLPSIRGVVCDAGALTGLVHRCDPFLCRHSGSCCAGYEVCVEEDELPRLTGALPLAARYAPQLRGPRGCESVFEELFEGLYAIETDESGLCVFSYQARQGMNLCSLHTAAVDLGLDLRQLKPRSCLLWPLALSGSRPRYLSVDPGAFSYPCNRRKPPDGCLHGSVAGIISDMLGKGFLGQLRKGLKE